jgi:hypothetical protein
MKMQVCFRQQGEIAAVRHGHIVAPARQLRAGQPGDPAGCVAAAGNAVTAGAATFYRGTG